MKKFFMVCGVLGIVVIIAITGMILTKKAPPSYKLNVKMTVTIETPEGDVSGSAVREIANKGTNSKLDWLGGNPASVRGEAVVIDLGARGKVFALINKDGEEARFYKAFPPPDGHPQSNATMAYYAQLPVGKSAVLEPDDWPMFVTFADMNDPRSVTLVRGGLFNPQTQKYDPVDDFEKIFGENVQLKSIMLEIATESFVSGKGVDKYLPADFWEKYADWWRSVSASEKMKYAKLFAFKAGEYK
ncbi:hypothetical protein [Micavibrio aeruginosavorus]|uniref:Uncharacterized protein n=1 Tax=Micavibrio aeruginosavorus (strain ARL-13) TaxID=856793 RepID=G2KQ89_MICAA|nr:hypothetical protein [Micavibrio aeruginosavorus]AEP08631.1 hypothetical protein MICA_286 [Micavibrio aeruginosavorus ARL-13]